MKCKKNLIMPSPQDCEQCTLICEEGASYKEDESEHLDFTTKKSLIAYIEDLMGEEGSWEGAETLTDYFLENDYFFLKWNGYHSTDKWVNMEDNEFCECWEAIL